MSYATIFAAALPALGTCRFCGCTEERGCKLWGSSLRCGWVDVRHTCCTAPKCLEQLDVLKPEADRALVLSECICRRHKRQHVPVCMGCYGSLPWPLQSPLCNVMDVGFPLVYADAKKFLTEQTGRLKGGR